MKRIIITLVALLAPSSVFANSPDLCIEEVLVNEVDEPYVDSQGVMLSRYCEWTGPGSPIWGGDVCCTIDAAGATCELPSPDTDECLSGVERFWCEHGQAVTGGGFVCYQEFVSACTVGSCAGGEPTIQAPDPSTENVICCIGGVCWPWDDKHGFQCEGEYMWCDDGYSKEDGTVECFD